MVGPAKLRQRTVNSLEDRVRIIEKLVEQDMLDPWLDRNCAHSGTDRENVSLARQLIGRAAGACELYSVFSFVESNVRYNGDANIAERVWTLSVAMRSLEMAIGDCDDMCGVVLALLRFQGYHAWLRVCSYANAPTNGSHLCCLSFPQGWSSTRSCHGRDARQGQDRR